MIGSLTYYCWIVWNYKNFWSSSDRFVGQIWFEKKIITYMKDEGSNFNAMVLL
jgi:hypothetical protein